MAKKSKRTNLKPKSPSTGPTSTPASPSASPVEVEAAHAQFPKNVVHPLIGFMRSFEPDTDAETVDKRADFAKDFLSREIEDHPIRDHYNILLLFDEGTMLRSDANAIYRAINGFKDKKPLLLILTSNGGEIAPAYLIARLCREKSNGKFAIAIPRQAKSAATLLCCGADELHVGSLSELGPIDPQINNKPTLGLKAAMEHVIELAAAAPSAGTMLADYLERSLPILDLGYFERVAESAKQYAERLLVQDERYSKEQSDKIGQCLVYEYKDHGFVIDKDEIREIFNPDTIKLHSPEYELSNKIYESLSFLSHLANQKGFGFHWIGSTSDACTTYKLRRR